MFTLEAGTVVAERFRLVRKLGEGGMGSVWLAHHEKLDTNCAVKFINADVASAAGVKERFEREAKIAAQIKSPHVVHVLDYGVSDGVPYIAMEYLEGEDLAHRLEARGRLSPEETLAVVGQIARALTKAHAAGLVHRDLKPENVYLVHDDDQELVKVLDFGIAKAQSPMPDGNTRTGMMMGTPRFMSPEQAQGLKTLDYRSDLWSLGVIAYRCVVGSLPFDSEAMGDLMMRIIVHPLPVPSAALPGLPPAFDAWWARAAARDPAARFQSAKELAETLAASFGFAPAISGPAARSGMGGPTPNSLPSSAFAPRAVTPAQGAPLSSSMIGAPTMLPTGQTAPPSHASLATPAPALLPTVGEHTMSPASRTFGAANQPPRKSPIVFVAIGAIAFGAIAAASVLALRGKGTDAASAPIASASAATSAPTADPKPSVEVAPQDVPTAAPTASATAAPSVPTSTKAAGPRQPPTPPVVPARRGKVKIVSP